MIRRDTVKLWIVIGLIAAPPALIGAFVDYPYCIVGAFVFALLAFIAGKIWPSRRALVLVLSGITGLAITIGLDLASRHEVVIVNQTGQPISGLMLSYGNHGKIIGRIPPATTAHVRIHDLMFDGHLDVAYEVFGDGTEIAEATGQMEGDPHGRGIRVIVESAGKVRRVRE